MQEHVTLLGPSELPFDGRGLSSSLPPDLLEQVRGRVRLLALLLLIAFSFDPLISFAMWAIATVAGYPVILGQLGFRLLDLGAVATSGALWWAARQRAVTGGPASHPWPAVPGGHLFLAGADHLLAVLSAEGHNPEPDLGFR